MRPHLAAVAAVCAFATLSAVVPSGAVQHPLTVPGTANLFGAGQATLPAPEGNGAGTTPILVNLPAGTGRSFQVITTSGLVSYTPTVAASGAEGVAYAPYMNCDWSGLSGYRLNGIRVLSAVAMSDSAPADPAPSKLLIDTLDFPALSPGVRQIFPVGDGLVGTGTGATQVFNLPDAATRLYLGFLDSFTGAAPGWYGDNSGQIALTIDVTGALAAVGEDVSNGLRITGRTRAADGSVALDFVARAGALVTAQVFDVTGRLLRSEQIEPVAGASRFTWNTRDASGSRVRSGLYLARLLQAGRKVTARVIVLR